MMFIVVFPCVFCALQRSSRDQEQVDTRLRAARTGNPLAGEFRGQIAESRAVVDGKIGGHGGATEEGVDVPCESRDRFGSSDPRSSRPCRNDAIPARARSLGRSLSAAMWLRLAGNAGGGSWGRAEALVYIQTIAPITFLVGRLFSFSPSIEGERGGRGPRRCSAVGIEVGQSHPIARTDVSVTPRPRAYDLEGGALRHYHLVLEARDIVRPSPPRAGLFDRTVLFRLRTRTPSKHALDEAERE